MKVLVLGASGMIGHRMWSTLSEFHDVYGGIRRSELGALENLPHIQKEKALFNLDAHNFEKVDSVIKDLRPDLVLNCIGIVKQLSTSKEHIPSIEMNALFPHKLAKLCSEVGARMIQFSTDCVFDGAKGMYTEADAPNAVDLYGCTKILGEVDYLENVLTMRTSTIGREVFPHGGLVEWFLSQRGKQVKGFSKAIYSGFPTHTLAKIINEYIVPNSNLSGVIHISSPAINKLELLKLIKQELDLDIEIHEDNSFEMERSLDCSLFMERTGFMQKSWKEIIKDLNIDNEFYNSLKR